MKCCSKYIIFLTSFGTISAKAQHFLQDSTHHLKEVTIISNKLDNFSAGLKVQKIDSNTISQHNNNSLADLLTDESSLFIKTYGPGSLATTSLRGGNSTHTVILWNGFNLNSPSTGQLDLSIIPINLSNSISIQYGGASALWGSGAISGTVNLTTNPKFGSGLTLIAGLSAGSYKDYSENISIEKSMKRFISSIKIFNHSSVNNFSYYNTANADTSLSNQRHAAYKQNGILTENFFRINNFQKINFCLWYQQNFYEIPPTMLQLENNSKQKTGNLRLTSEWARTTDKYILINRIAYFEERLTFNDENLSYTAFTNTKTVIGESEVKENLNSKFLINLGMNNTFVKAFSTDYVNQARQNRTAFFASQRFISENKKTQINISIRQEIIKSKFVPFTFTVGSDFCLLKWLTAKASFSKVYRIPTFNDMYWLPGGNTELLPESGYCEEAGFIFHHKSKLEKVGIFFEPTIFNRNMDNWIIWIPGQSFWSPQNLMEVHSRGMETRSEMELQTLNLKFKWTLFTNYVLSTSEKPKTTFDASAGKQLIYVPMYSGFAKFSIEYKGFLFSYHHSYTGYRYTTTDNTEFLKPYYLGNVYLSKKIVVKKSEISLFFHINNLYNKNYQVLLYRPMPLRNYQFGLSLKLKNIN